MLNAIEVPTYIANRILEDYSPKYVERVDNLEQYRANGYCDIEKHIIRYTKYEDNKSRVFICQAYVLQHYFNNIFCVDMPHLNKFEDWMQIWCRIVDDDSNWNKPTVNGQKAWNTIMSLLTAKYSRQEINRIMEEHSAEYNEKKKQFHYYWSTENKFDVEIYSDCRKYDICGAHHDALREMFPKCAPDFQKLYEERKKKPENKLLVNFFVGMLCRKGYRQTYNWIVQRTNELLQNAIWEAKGILLYANTDGFIVYKGNALNTSNELGSLRLEYEGPVCICEGSNYWIYQTKDELKGNIPINLRESINLFEGKTISYDIRTKHLKDRKGEEFFVIKNCENIKEGIFNVVSI